MSLLLKKFTQLICDDVLDVFERFQSVPYSRITTSDLIKQMKYGVELNKLIY